jgi:hypothetical protein
MSGSSPQWLGRDPWPASVCLHVEGQLHRQARRWELEPLLSETESIRRAISFCGLAATSLFGACSVCAKERSRSLCSNLSGLGGAQIPCFALWSAKKWSQVSKKLIRQSRRTRHVRCSALARRWREVSSAIGTIRGSGTPIPQTQISAHERKRDNGGRAPEVHQL